MRIAANPVLAAAEDGSSASTHAQADVQVVAVRPNFYMLTAGERNIALQVGEDGAVVVDTGPPGWGEAVVRAIKGITAAPIRYVINTSADPDSVGNNAAVSIAGLKLGAVNAVAGSNALGLRDSQAAPIIAYQNVLNRMIASPPPGVTYATDAYPNQIFDSPNMNFYLNGGQINVIWEPGAHSDGDSAVVFRRDDVVVTGALLDITRFPVIDLASGGSIQGEIDAINRLIDTHVTAATPLGWRADGQYGTLVIPARGHVSQQADMVQYRDMLTIIRDRVAYYMKMGKSLQQVVALQPASGYAPRFGGTAADWTTDKFVEAVYRSLSDGRRPQARREH